MNETRCPRFRLLHVVACSIVAVMLIATACSSDEPESLEGPVLEEADAAPESGDDTDDQMERETDPETGLEADPVAEDSWDAGVHQLAVDTLLGWDVFDGTGCADGSGLCPDEPLRNWELAVWLVRVLEGEEPPEVAESSFADVDGDSWWAAHIESLAELQVAVGCADEPLQFCPDQEVSRGQMAAFVVRGFWLGGGSPQGFVDVDRDYAFAADIDALVEARIAVSCSSDPLRFCPERSVTRAEMATYLARALGLIDVPRPEYSETLGGLAVGGRHVCGLRLDGSLLCWGNNDWGQSDAPSGAFRAVAVGELHSCGVGVDGAVVCWGDNSLGQVEAPSGVFGAVAAGAAHSCALRENGSVVCWGDNSLGQVEAPSGVFESVSAGDAHSCALRENGSVVCWGDNSLGQVEAPSGVFGAVAAGAAHSCALRENGSVVCWGDNSLGQVEAPSGVFESVSVGGVHSCGVNVDGAVVCWGDNSLGQVEAPSGVFGAVAAGAAHSCALRENGSVVCWGERLRE